MARRVCNFLQLSCVFYSEQVYMLYYLNNIRHLKHKTLKYNSTEVIFPFCHIDKKKSNISKSLSKPSPSLVKLINQLNNFTEETKDYDENLPNCQYRDFGYFQNFSEKIKRR